MSSPEDPSSEARRPARVIAGDLRLLPVVELTPSRYGAAPHPTTSPWPAEESEAYWRACLGQSGLVGLIPSWPRGRRSAAGLRRERLGLGAALRCRTGAGGRGGRDARRSGVEVDYGA